MFQQNTARQPAGPEASPLRFAGPVSTFILQLLLGEPKVQEPEEAKDIIKVLATDSDKQVNSEELHSYSRLHTQAALTASFCCDLTVLTGTISC